MNCGRSLLKLTLSEVRVIAGGVGFAQRREVPLMSIARDHRIKTSFRARLMLPSGLCSGSVRQALNEMFSQNAVCSGESHRWAGLLIVATFLYGERDSSQANCGYSLFSSSFTNNSRDDH